jgi:hypothetical protein
VARVAHPSIERQVSLLKRVQLVIGHGRGIGRPAEKDHGVSVDLHRARLSV